MQSSRRETLRIKSLRELCVFSASEAVKSHLLKANQKCVKSAILVLYLLSIYSIIKIFI
jgi:hypothetical protein